MDGKAKLLAAIDSDDGVCEEDWLCIMPLLGAYDPLWDDVTNNGHTYYIPKKHKERLKEMISQPEVVITDNEDSVSALDDEMLPDHERIDRGARRYYQLATDAYDVGDYIEAYSQIESALELDGTSPEYLSFATTIIGAMEKAEADKKAKPIDVSTLRCGACRGPYHEATGHAFFVKGELKGVACGICAGRWFAAKARKNGWRPVKQSKKARRQRRKREEQQRHLINAQRIIAEARGQNVYPHWPDDAY